jgi:hypothetical protein
MSNLPHWAAWVIVAASPLIAFLVVLPIAVVDRWISGARGLRPTRRLSLSNPIQLSRLRRDCRRR